jgi:peptidyl-dipeptidase Dcp
MAKQAGTSKGKSAGKQVAPPAAKPGTGRASEQASTSRKNDGNVELAAAKAAAPLSPEPAPVEAAPVAVGPNPLLAAWIGPFEIPPFGEIQAGHFLPAYEKAMAEHNAEVEAIAGSKSRPTFANTIEGLERSGRLMKRVGGVFWNRAGAHTDEAIQAIEREMAPRLAAHYNAITSNAALFARIDELHRRSAKLKLGEEQARVLERIHRGYVRAGARLDVAAKARIGEIKQRLAALGTAFSQNVLADEKAWELPLATATDREGLPDFLIAAAAGAAKERGSNASHVITLSRSLIEPFLMFSSRRDLREQAWKAWVKRGDNGGPTDNWAIVTETLKLREEQARLLGYATYAAFKLDDTMAKTPEAVRELLETVWTPARAKAAAECEKLQAKAAAEGANITIEPWDWRYYSDKVRRADYAIDEAEIKPYLALDNVLAAAFSTATRLFGLAFCELHGLPLLHPDVRAFEVTDAKGVHVGLFLGDYFARPSKRSGAWMSAYRGQERLTADVRPIIANTCNFAKAPADQSTLLSLDDARTLFHEFGHALHGLLSDVKYPSLAGTAVSRDFVELPSQLYEHWLTAPELLQEFALHHETGDAMPRELIDRIRAASTFNQGFATVEFLASAIVDMDFHAGPAPADPKALEAATLERIGLPREIVMRHRTPHFAHVFSGEGYSAGYYSYMWSEVLDADAFSAFLETGDIFNRRVAERLRKFVYAAGGSREEEAAYKGFRGRLPSVDGLLKKRGLDKAA